MEQLQRTPSNPNEGKTMDIVDANGLVQTITFAPLSVRTMMAVTAHSKSDEEKGMKILAAQVLVNGVGITYDDLLDKFNMSEIEEIASLLGEKN